MTVLGNTNNLVRSGFVFGGWNTEPDGTGASYVPSAKFYIQSAFITGSVNMLYAQWGTSTVAGGCTLDEDGSGGAPDALTDGLLLMRAMFGLTGTAVTNGAVKSWIRRSPSQGSRLRSPNRGHRESQRFLHPRGIVVCRTAWRLPTLDIARQVLLSSTRVP